jgi:hypothetical protein
MNEYYKKIDKSFFDGLTTVPKEYVECFADRSEFDKYTSRDITVIYKKKSYIGKLCFVHQKSGRNVLQIQFNQRELLNILKQDFIQTYFAIQSQKMLNPSDKKFKTSILGGNQEVVIFKLLNRSIIELIPFIRIETPYDNVFKNLVERNVFGWISKEENTQMIYKYSGWESINNLNKYADTPFVIYYLIDEDNKELYIGSAKRLGDRVKPGRHEIPNWNKFMFEIVHPDYHHCLKEIEYHSIMTFSKFLKNNGNKKSLDISSYKLVNKDYKYYRN